MYERDLTLRRDDGQPKQLYTILPQKETSIRGFMGSQHGYDLGKKKEDVEISLNPDEIEGGLDSEAVKRKYEATLEPAATGVLAGLPKEDLSDMVKEHESKMAKKKQKKDDKGRDGKKFKF